MKSKDRIVESLIELMKTNEFEAITVYPNWRKLIDPHITVTLNQKKTSSNTNWS